MVKRSLVNFQLSSGETRLLLDLLDCELASSEGSRHIPEEYETMVVLYDIVSRALDDYRYGSGGE